MNHVILANAVSARSTIPAHEKFVIVAIAFNHAATITGYFFKNN